MTQPTHHSVALLACITAVFLWASAFVGIRHVVGFYGPGEMAFLRYLVASVVMLIFYFSPGGKRSLTWSVMPAITGLGLVGISFYNVVLNQAEQTITAGTASFIFTQVPILSAIFSYFILKERLSRVGLFGLLVSLTGVLTIALAHHALHASMGVAFALLAAISGALYSNCQKPILTKVAPFDFIAGVIWTGTIGLLFYAPQAVIQLQQIDWHVTAWVVYMGIFPAAIAYGLWSVGIKNMPVTKAVSTIYLLPFFTMAMAYYLLHEHPDWVTIIGGLVALTGTVIVNKASVSH